MESLKTLGRPDGALFAELVDSLDGRGFFDLLSDSLVEGFFVNVECLGYHDVNLCSGVLR